VQLLRLVNDSQKMSKSKTVHEMTTAGLDGHWETTAPLTCTAAAMTAWCSLVHSVLMRCLRSSRSDTRLCTPCSLPHTL